MSGGVALLERDTLAVMLALAPRVREGVGEAERVELPESVVLGVGAAVPVLLPVGEPVGVWLGVGAAVVLPLCDRLGVALALAPGDSVEVGLAEKVLLALRVLLGVTLPVLVPVPVPELLGVCEAVCEAVALGVSEMLGVTEGDTPGGRDAVGEADRVPLALSVEEGVDAGVPVPLAVGLCVPEAVGVTGGVALLDRLVEPVLEALAPLDSDAVALEEVVLLALTVLVGVLLLVLVPEVVAVALGVCDAV